ncbi:helix-turn-helix transcriptional regulator [Clostridium botulinum]|nr:helix-turn-helix transcriptional regulator [Clostridium botulinum]MBY6812618.1 helix-turn-helix transcriptional regulator [Clostridium botulinum]MBY6819274.1 helix-turn-helix transcriptional regulator [Clostridium botulinum]NFG42054.1 helix-turn-helix transcriptional regulator [Clostridium botulinum]NFJ50689.1 helix-turn-helix transcriptional regulator [Clostridium botulinum]
MLYIYNIYDTLYYIRRYVVVKRQKIFNTKIKLLRVERGITQEDLAIDLGVNRSTISEIERGTFNPSLKLAFSIANYFGRTIDEIFEILEDDNNE